MIDVRGLTKTFGAVEAVRGITFSVGAGEIVGFLGPNGAGKTTTMRILAGIFPPTSGEVRIAGHDPLKDPLACRRAVGYFPEYAPFYPDLRVEEYLAFVARMKRVARPARADAVATVLASCGLTHVARRRIGTLSKGYRQRFGLAQALCGDPPVLILDEPTIGLDPEQVADIRGLVRGLRGTRTVFFSSHILSEVEALCERVVVIARGRVMGEGTPQELEARLGRGQRIVIRLDAPRDVVAAAFAAVAGIRCVGRDDGGFVLESTGATDVARVADELARRRGWSILELRAETVDLEDVFLRLVRDREAVA